MPPLIRILRSRTITVNEKVGGTKRESLTLDAVPGLPPKASSSSSAGPDMAGHGASSSRTSSTHSRGDRSANTARPSSPTNRDARQQQQQKIKIKKEADRGPIASSSSSSPPPQPSTATAPSDSLAGTLSSLAAERLSREAEPMDLDDAPPSRPSRTYAKARHKRRHGSTSTGRFKQSDDSASSDESHRGTPDREDGISDENDDDEEEEEEGRVKESRIRRDQPGARVKKAGGTDPAPSHSATSSSAAPQSSRPLGIRLKLNPTRAPTGIAALGAAHRPTGIHPDGLAIQAGGIGAAGTSATPFNWSLPEEPATLVPPPPVSRPPKPYPTRPEEVDEDFTAMDWKERERQRDREEAILSTNSASASPAPGQMHTHKDPPGGAIGSAAANRVRSQNQQQITYQAFQSYIEGWFKSVTEEDVAWLGRTEERGAIFDMPALGRHYKEVWAEEDTPTYLSTYPNYSADEAAMTTDRRQGGARAAPTVPPFDPRTLSDEHAYGTAPNEAASGPFAERVLSMLLAPGPSPPQHLEHPAANGADSSQHASTSNGSGPNPLMAMPRAPPPQDLAMYEERIQEELRLLDLLPPEQSVDWTNPEDDEISAMLRNVQHLLAKQMDVNEKRRHRLRDIAKDRMAYQDYATCLNNVEKQVEQGWYKRQSLLKKLISKKKSSKGGSGGSEPPGGPSQQTKTSASSALTNTAAGLEAAAAIAAGNTSSTSVSGTVTPSGEGHHYLSVPPLAESLVAAMEKRNQLKKAFEPMFEAMAHAKYIPMPDQSVFADLDLESGGEEEDGMEL